METERYTSSSIAMMRKIVTIVMSFKLEFAIAQRVRGERSRAADVDLEPGRRRVLRDDVPNGVNGLIRLNLADIARETQ